LIDYVWAYDGKGRHNGCRRRKPLAGHNRTKLEVLFTMKHRMIAGLFTFAALAVAGATAGGALKSGPQVGENLAGPFHPLNCTGKMEGKKHCLV
jgi:hypothetical protein